MNIKATFGGNDGHGNARQHLKLTHQFRSDRPLLGTTLTLSSMNAISPFITMYGEEEEDRLIDRSICTGKVLLV